MCGIFGVVAEVGRKVALEDRELLRMRDTMRSRGPDGAGLFVHANVAFGHRRLAIRDLTGGAQPWLSDDRRLALVYNGELYNDVQLRQELEKKGHRFRSRCDTEVVLASYSEWGEACLERFRGMFAFGIYDFRGDQLLLARDRFGIKPLFIAEIDGDLVFASSVPAVLAHPRFARRPNVPAISHYATTLRLNLGRQTLYSGIWQLLPGECLRLQAGETTVKRYWQFPLETEDDLQFEEAVEELESRLDESLGVRMASDVPVGMFLSGGVDSSTLAFLHQRRAGTPMVAQCGGGDQPEPPDFEHAKLCAELVGMDFEEVRVPAAEYLAGWMQLVQQYGTPLSTPSDVIIHELARHMKRSVGVVLGGEGADELLCGYAVQHWSSRDFAASRQLARGGWSHGPVAARRFQQAMQEQYGRTEFLSETDHYFALNSLIPTSAKASLLQPWAWKEAEEDRVMFDRYGELFSSFRTASAPQTYARLLHYLNLESLLSRLDTATMQAGLEARVPYTDHHLVEWVYRLPHRYKIDVSAEEQAPFLPSGQLEARGSLRSKRLLRALAARLMPEPLATRRKASFPTPVAAWLAGPWRAWAAERLQESPFLQAVFQRAALRDLAENVQQAGMWLWPLLNLGLWGDREFN